MPSWKKIIVSGSNAELNQITSSAGINIKTVGSLTNGISFGDGNTGFYETADNDLKFDRAGSNVFQANTSSQLAFGVSSLFRNTTGGFLISTGATTTGANYSFRGDENTGIGRPAADQVSVIAGGVQELIVKANTISGSATSTGSFGKLLGDGSSLTGIDTDLSGDTTPQLGGNLDLNSNNITGTGNIDILGTITAQNFIVSSSVTSIEYQSISGSTIFGDTADDTHTFLGDTISGSLTSTGSFGHITTPGGIDAVGPISFQTTSAANDINFRTAGTSGYPLQLKNSNDSAVIYFQTNGDVTNILMKGNNKSNLLKLSADGLTETRGQVGSAHADGNLELYSNNGLNNLILSASMTTISGSGDTTLDVKGNIFSEGNISGSATSTGSFGRVEATKLVGDGSGITGLTSAAISSYTNNGNNRIITSVNSSTVNGEANLTFDGSTLDVTGDLTLSGDLTVNGTTTTIATTNLQIQDAFGFFATGSAGTNVDAGIIVQSGSFIDSGSALYHDISKERWSVGKGIASTATNVPDSKWGGFVATVYTASASPVGSSPKYGVGEIHVDDDGEIYIYS